MNTSEKLSRYNGKAVVIAGPTGSGKTGVSIEIAKEIGGEIISADSRAIYKGMDIGTAKPSMKERDGVPHFGFDLIEPGERFTVADWKEYAERKIEEVRNRGHVPIIVGGTGLYIDALIYNYSFTDEAKNKYLDRKKMCSDFVVVCIGWEKAKLVERLKLRADKIFVQELYDETRELVKKYDWNTQAMKSNIYQFAWEYMCGKKSLKEAKSQFVTDDWHLAKRQITWFRRNKQIEWLPLEKVKPYVLKCIQNE